MNTCNLVHQSITNKLDFSFKYKNNESKLNCSYKYIYNYMVIHI